MIFSSQHSQCSLLVLQVSVLTFVRFFWGGKVLNNYNFDLKMTLDEKSKDYQRYYIHPEGGINICSC